MKRLIIIRFVYNANFSGLFVFFFTYKYKSTVKNSVSKVIFSFLLLFLDYWITFRNFSL